MIDCSLAALSQRLKMSWLRAQVGGAVGKLRLATLLNTLFSFAGSGDQVDTVDLSVFLVSMHVVPSRQPGWLDKLVDEQSSSFSVSGRIAFSNGEINFSIFLHNQSSTGNLIKTFAVGWTQELANGLSSAEETLSNSGI